MLARTKLTDIKSQQDYLLFISKMNLKGLLVSSLPKMPIGNPVKLQLTMGDRLAPVELEGEIYKIVPTPQGWNGTIIRFVNTTPGIEKKLKTFISEYDREIQKTTAEKKVRSSLVEKTTMVHESSLSHLALSSPDKDSGAIAYTIDEEAFLSGDTGLSGHTMIAAIKKEKKPKKSRKRLYLVILVLGSSIGAFMYRDVWFPYKFFSSILAFTKNIPRLRPPSTKETGTESQVEEVFSGPGTIDEVLFSESAAGVTVTIGGSGDFKTHFISKNFDPEGLIIDLPSFEKLEAEEAVTVKKNPIKQVRLLKQSKGIRIYFDLMGSSFPEYDVETDSASIQVTFNK
ncbi:MAG: hypothetical protein KDD48_07115 [Bdellovibrionales bacterium]|nr:hypothetical protein [Bdellovibrionales bacterium]